MTGSTMAQEPRTHASVSPGTRSSTLVSLLKLARPHQWTKCGFVLLGPLYGLPDLDMAWGVWALRVVIACVVFALASSASYVVNDVLDADQDRTHPRKRHRPVASGAISERVAVGYAAALFLAAAALFVFMPAQPRLWLGVAVGAYVINVFVYSLFLKNVVIADVMGLSLGFVLRVLGGCAAVGIAPSSWLLNCTFFLAMFLAFGKRLGERRALGAADAHAARRVQAVYTDSLLQMTMVVTGVATLVGYTVWIEDQADLYTAGFNPLWITVLPATYALFRSMVLLDRGQYDDPTELALGDRAFQAGALVFGLLTIGVMWHFRRVSGGG